ncbi:MAG: MBL fold metallo-hydrolase [Gammaproteobacteria bacterium]|nr:MBL fold metallo-hydrolase [Gammaproteobacteria bacterium]
MYDTGPKFFTGGDVAQSIIIPYLYYHGWKNIDGLLVSHGDADHSGGAKTLREQFTIPLVWTSDLKRVPKAMRCERGQEWHWDGVDFKILYPDSAVKFHGNNRSCVLKMSIGETSALLVGDIEVEAENYLIDHLSDELSTDVLSVPHHGSKTSSSENFFKRDASSLCGFFLWFFKSLSLSSFCRRSALCQPSYSNTHDRKWSCIHRHDCDGFDNFSRAIA